MSITNPSSPTSVTLYLFVGYPGAGKTTAASIIEQATGATHIWTDHERHAMFKNPSHSSQENEALYSYLNKKAEQLLKAGTSVIFDTNFNFKRDRDYLRQIATKAGAQTIIIWLATDKAVAKERATHDDHRQRNRYDTVMTPETFDALSNHLEIPTAEEAAIKIDGLAIDAEALIAFITQRTMPD